MVDLGVSSLMGHTLTTWEARTGIELPHEHIGKDVVGCKLLLSKRDFHAANTLSVKAKVSLSFRCE